MERDQWPEGDLLFTEFSEMVNANYILHKGDLAEAFVRVLAQRSLPGMRAIDSCD
jgi:hypothetical protein